MGTLAGVLPRTSRQSFAVPAKVSWQMLEIEFDVRSKRLHQEGDRPSVAEEDSPAVSTPDYEHAVANELHLKSSIFGKSVHAEDDGHSATETVKPADANKSLVPDAKEDNALNVVNYTEQAGTHTSRKGARTKLAEAMSLLKSGVAFDVVAKKFSTGSTAERGGWQSPVDPEVIADKRTANALRQLPEGQISEVIETGPSFRVIRVASRAPAGWRPFEEVEDSIKQAITADLQKEALEELYSRTTVESPYIDKFLCRKFGRREPRRASKRTLSRSRCSGKVTEPGTRLPLGELARVMSIEKSQMDDELDFDRAGAAISRSAFVDSKQTASIANRQSIRRGRFPTMARW